MAEPTRRKARRSTLVTRRLEELRERNSAQLAEQRRKEQRIDDALATYVEAEERITAAMAERDRRIEPHERAIAALREQFDQDEGEQEAAKGQAALAIHESDRTVEQVAELLGVGEKLARRLITLGRKAAAEAQPAQQLPVSTNGDEPARTPMASTGPASGRADDRAPMSAGGDTGAAALRR